MLNPSYKVIRVNHLSVSKHQLRPMRGLGSGAEIGQDFAMLSEEEARFLAGRRVGHLATADARAVPQIVPVCFIESKGTLYITIDRKPKGDPHGLKRLRNIAENSAVSFVADRYDEDWGRLGWVMLRGTAMIIERGSEHDEAQALLRQRYPQYQRMNLGELPVIAIRIERVTSWGDLSTDTLPAG